MKFNKLNKSPQILRGSFAAVSTPIFQYFPRSTRCTYLCTAQASNFQEKTRHNSGGFDDDLFAHMEEIDLCWRMQNLGHEIFVEPKSEVYHLGGGTLSEGSSFKYFLNYRNNLILITKNLASSFWLGTLFWRMILDGISALKFVFWKPIFDFVFLKNGWRSGKNHIDQVS